jgi:steroid delta-isomerase
MHHLVRQFPALPVLVAVALLGGCGGQSPLPSATALNESYEIALDLTARNAGRFGAGSVREREMLDRLAGYFANMTPDSVASGTALVYADSAYLNDNITFVEGADAIEDYFRAAAEQASSVRVEFQDIARAGSDYYVRWRMTITTDRLNDGEPMESFGVSHFRFDPEGRVLIHKDFWDAGTGIYEYLPGIGGLINALRGRLAHQG